MTLRPLAPLALLLLALAAPADAQVSAPPPLRVFMDCERCDFDHFRREVPVVDYVRDRQDADLHVLVTRQTTGAGGTEYTFHFLGLRELAQLADTLRFVSRQTDTDSEVRDGLTRTLRLGLVRYLAHTARADVVDVVFPEPDEVPGLRVSTTPADDPWNLWVFRARVAGEVEGESRTKATVLDGSFSASRTTEDFKIDLRVSGEYEEDEFELRSGETLVSSATEAGVEGTAVWSLSPHWSWGVSASAARSSPLNQKLALRAAPALEYSFYPYAESTRRQITVLYKAGVSAFRYDEPTLFDRSSETRPEQSLQIAADFTQPWGELVVSLAGSNYLDDFSQHRLDLFARLEIRLFRGVSLDIDGSLARIKDQVYVAREEVSDEEVLLRRKELGTDFEYSVDVGLSFTFGSLFNNVVNPRIRTPQNDRYY